MLHIENVFSVQDCAAIRESLCDSALWLDGRSTVSGTVRDVKSNEQADTDLPVVKAVLQQAETALRANETFCKAALPAQFARILVNRYRSGMQYGAHTDAPYMLGIRTDLSFTLFLSPPESYEGGELIVENPGGEMVVKGEAGAMVLYPASAVHRVAPVTDGERVACVGWVKSRVRSAEQRAVIFDLEVILSHLRQQETAKAVRTRLRNTRNNLIRMFGE